jgi:hypothetical protein
MEDETMNTYKAYRVLTGMAEVVDMARLHGLANWLYKIGADKLAQSTGYKGTMPVEVTTMPVQPNIVDLPIRYNGHVYLIEADRIAEGRR